MDHAAPGLPAAPTIPARGVRARRNLVHLALDLAIGVGSGLLLHEWLGLAIIPALVTHLLLNWDWFVATARRSFRQMPGTLRLSAVLNTLLFVAMTLVTVSGVLISEAVVPGLAIGGTGRGFWRFLHTQAANATLIIVGLHLALHWRWLLGTARQGLRGAWRPGRQRAALADTAVRGEAVAR